MSYARMSEASAILVRAGACVHRDIFCKHKQFLLKTFTVLADTEAAQEVHNARWCMLDPFTWAFNEAFPSVVALESKEAAATLAGIACVQRVDTVPNSCMFSQANRTNRLKGKTSASQVQAVSADMLLKRQQVIEDSVEMFVSREQAKKTRIDAAKDVLQHGPRAVHHGEGQDIEERRGVPAPRKEEVRGGRS